MKYLILIYSLFPTLSFSQVKVEDIVRKDGLAFEKNATIPFTGKALGYFSNGDVQTIVEYKDGIMNGELKSWYKNNAKQIEGFVDKGKQTGTWKLYYETGILKKQTNYLNGLENGEEIFWFENGKIEKKGSYLSGKLNGKYEWYYENGQKKQEGFFVNGKEDSTWNEWHENGKLKMIGHFSNLEKNGEWIWWDENSKITTSKVYKNGLVSVEQDNFDTYLEKFEFFLAKKNFKESLKNVKLAESTITDKTENNFIYMGLVVYHSKAYSLFSHYRQGEKILLDAIGLTESQSEIIQNSHKEKSPEKLEQLIKEIKKKGKSKLGTGDHIALGLCYNILNDAVHLRDEQQLMMEKGAMQDWVINLSLELYKLATERANNYFALEDINNKISKEGLSEKLELDKAHYLIRTENFEEAQKIIDRYLQSNQQNLTALLLKADIEMALGNVENMKVYEKKALAIDPNAFSNIKE